MLDNIDSIKAALNKELESKDLQHDKIIKLSQELDKLILEFHHTEGYAGLVKDKIGK